MDRIVYMGNANVYVKTDIKANKQLYKYMIHKYQQHVLRFAEYTKCNKI